jgi:hypothetical protein
MSNRDNFTIVEAPKATAEAALAVVLYEQVPPLYVSPLTGIDWQIALSGLAEGQPGFAFDGTTACRLGNIHDLLPSGKWYTPWMVGQTVSAEEAKADRAWWEELKAKANALGLRVTVEPTTGESIWVEADLTVVLPTVIDGKPALIRVKI